MTARLLAAALAALVGAGCAKEAPPQYELTPHEIDNYRAIVLEGRMLDGNILPMLSAKSEVVVEFIGGLDVECSDGVGVCIDFASLPREDTPFPCGNPDHWLVRYK